MKVATDRDASPFSDPRCLTKYVAAFVRLIHVRNVSYNLVVKFPLLANHVASLSAHPTCKSGVNLSEKLIMHLKGTNDYLKIFQHIVLFL